MAAMAEFLGFPEEFFFMATPPMPTDEGIAFRSYARLSAARRDAAMAAASIAIELSSWVEGRFELPAADLPELHGVDPATAAVVVRTEWALGNEPAPNMIHLLEAHGVRVFSLTDDCAELDAFSLWEGDHPYVFLTRHKSPERARWDAAHELAHLVLHFGVPTGRRDLEHEADRFAAEFLLPTAGLAGAPRRIPTLNEVRHEKLVWRVSAMAYIRRLEQLGRFTEWQYRSLVIAASEAGFRRHEGDIDRETSKLIPAVLEMLRTDGVRLADIAKDLSINTADVRGLLFSTLESIEGESIDSDPRPSTSPALRIVRGKCT
jgi:Zn-dependent peptidase ImmA (M78 family)